MLRCLPLIFLSYLLPPLTLYQPLSSSYSPTLFSTSPPPTCAVLRCLSFLFLYAFSFCWSICCCTIGVSTLCWWWHCFVRWMDILGCVDCAVDACDWSDWKDVESSFASLTKFGYCSWSIFNSLVLDTDRMLWLLLSCGVVYVCLLLLNSNSATDRAWRERTGQDRTRSDRTRNDRTGQETTGQDATGPDLTGHKRNGTGHCGYYYIVVLCMYVCYS